MSIRRTRIEAGHCRIAGRILFALAASRAALCCDAGRLAQKIVNPDAQDAQCAFVTRCTIRRVACAAG